MTLHRDTVSTHPVTILKATRTYPRKLSNNQHSPSVHPTVVSPLKVRQLSTISALNSFPATSVVNRIRTVAHT